MPSTPPPHLRSPGIRHPGYGGQPWPRPGPTKPRSQSSPFSKAGLSPNPAAILVTQVRIQRCSDQHQCLCGCCEARLPVQVRSGRVQHPPGGMHHYDPPVPGTASLLSPALRSDSGHKKVGSGEARTPRRGSAAPPLPSEDVRRRPTLPHPPECSTIGAIELSFRVRNGTGRFLDAMTAVTRRDPTSPHTTTKPVMLGLFSGNRTVDANTHQ